MSVLITNNANTILASGITSGATSIPLNTGTGALFPNPGSPDVFYATLIAAANPAFYEIVKVTARSTDSVTVVRAQDGTTAKAFSASDIFALLPTAATANGMRNLASLPTSTGSANAQAVANSVPLAIVGRGSFQAMIPGFTNMGSMTLNPDGNGAVTCKAFGQNLQAGMVVLNVPAVFYHDGTNYNLLNPQVPFAQLPTSTGSANAQAVANTTNPIKALVAGICQAFKAGFTNTAAATLNPDGLGTTTLQAWGQALIGGEIVAGNTVETEYDGTNLQVLNPLITALGLVSGALEATVFLANGTFTPKTTGNYLVIAIGGGGSGGGGGGGVSGVGGQGGSGGSGGVIGFSVVSLTAATGYAVVIGTAGANGAQGSASGGNGGNGGNGGDTKFNAVTIGAGGQGGQGGRGQSQGSGAGGLAGMNGGGNGGGVGGLTAAGTGGTGTVGATNSGGGGGGGSGGNNANLGGVGAGGGSGILIVIRA